MVAPLLGTCRSSRSKGGSRVHRRGRLRARPLRRAMAPGPGPYASKRTVAPRERATHCRVRRSLGSGRGLFPGSTYRSTHQRRAARAALRRRRSPTALLYLGVPTVALVAAAFIGAAPRARCASLALAVTAALLALGHHTVFHEIAVALVPPLRLLRYPSKAMVFAAFGWALLAGLGFERWRRSDTVPGSGGPGRSWPVPCSSRGASRSRCRPVAAEPVWPRLACGADDPLDVVRGPRPCRVEARVHGVARRGCRRRGARSAEAAPAAGGLACLVAVLAVLDLGVAGIGVNPTVPGDFFRFRPPILAEVRQYDLSRLYVYRFALPPASARAGLGTDNPYRIARYPPGFSLDAGRALAARLYLMPPVGGILGPVRKLRAGPRRPVSTYLADLTRWMAMAEGTPTYLRFLQMGAVKYVSALHVQGLEDLIPAGVYTSLLARPVRLFQVPEPLPRTYVVGTALAADGDLAREILFDAGFDPSREVILPETALQAGPRFSGRSGVLDFRPDYVRLQAELSEPGVVVLVDTYDPGWKATVDGRPARVLRANVAFRGVWSRRGGTLSSMSIDPGPSSGGWGRPPRRRSPVWPWRWPASAAERRWTLHAQGGAPTRAVALRGAPPGRAVAVRGPALRGLGLVLPRHHRGIRSGLHVRRAGPAAGNLAVVEPHRRCGSSLPAGLSGGPPAPPAGGGEGRALARSTAPPAAGNVRRHGARPRPRRRAGGGLGGRTLLRAFGLPALGREPHGEPVRGRGLGAVGPDRLPDPGGGFRGPGDPRCSRWRPRRRWPRCRPRS